MQFGTTCKVSESTSLFERLNKSFEILNDVLFVGQHNMHLQDFSNETTIKQQIKFVKKGTDAKLKHKTKNKKKKFVCHYCKKPGHIRPYGTELSLNLAKSQNSSVSNQHQSGVNCMVVYTSLKTNISES